MLLIDSKTVINSFYLVGMQQGTFTGLQTMDHHGWMQCNAMTLHTHESNRIFPSQTQKDQDIPDIYKRS